MTEKPKVYTLEEIAQILGLTRRTIYTYVHNGYLKAVKIGRGWRVSEAALNEFLSQGTESENGDD